jgi:transcriptional regulator with XRE-family HTH domain
MPVMTPRRLELARIIGANLRTLRADKRLSQEKVARLIDMSRETVRSAESGEHLPEWPTLERFAEAYGVDLMDLVTPRDGDLATGRKASGDVTPKAA